MERSSPSLAKTFGVKKPKRLKRVSAQRMADGRIICEKRLAHRTLVRVVDNGVRRKNPISLFDACARYLHSSQGVFYEFVNDD